MAVVALCAALTAFSVAVRGTELVPERYLRPRDFNHHPFTDVGEAATAKPTGLSDVHPYAILSSKRPREGRQFGDQEHVLYPNPPAAVLPRKQPALHIRVQPAHFDADPYNIIPKNYAFSYSVKDKHSGDDFSHSQAHNGKATRGQYRVKLPDGRVQVVSYTADHKGYRADVQYEGAPAHHFPYQQPTPIYEHTTPAPDAYVHQAPQHYAHYSPTPATYFQTAHQYVQQQPTYTATPSPYQQEQAYSPTPAPYQQEQAYSPTPATYADYGQQAYAGPTAGYRHHLVPYNSQYARPASPVPESNVASPSPITFPTSAPEQQAPQQSPALQAYASPSPVPEQSYQHASGLQAYASPSPTPDHAYHHSQGLQAYASPSPTPDHAYQNSQGLQAYASPSPTPDHAYQNSQGLQAYASPSPTPDHAYQHFQGLQAYASPSPTPEHTYQHSPGLQAYASPSPTPEHRYQHSSGDEGYESPSGPEFDHGYSPSPSPFAVQPHLRSTPTPFGRHQYVTSTESSPLGQIVVTPRTQRNSNSGSDSNNENNANEASRRVFGERQHVIYRFKSSS